MADHRSLKEPKKMNAVSVEIIGRTIEQFVVREFWLEGKLSSPCCLIFLQDEVGRTWKASFDDEIQEWIIKRLEEDIPEIGSVIDAGPFEYRHVALLDREKLAQRAVTAIAAFARDGSAILSLEFEGSVELVARYNFDSEKEDYLVLDTGIRATP